jgi:hypothetical protein
MTSFVIALNACWNVSVFVTTVMDKPQNAHAPTGRGVRTRPVIVLRKMASNVHARGSTAAGQGTRNLITNPTATDAHAAPIFAPFHTNPGAAGGGAEASAAAAATTTEAAAARHAEGARRDAERERADPARRRDVAGPRTRGATRRAGEVTSARAAGEARARVPERREATRR